MACAEFVLRVCRSNIDVSCIKGSNIADISVAYCHLPCNTRLFITACLNQFRFVWKGNGFFRSLWLFLKQLKVYFPVYILYGRLNLDDSRNSIIWSIELFSPFVGHNNYLLYWKVDFCFFKIEIVVEIFIVYTESQIDVSMRNPVIWLLFVCISRNSL